MTDINKTTASLRVRIVSGILALLFSYGFWAVRNHDFFAMPDGSKRFPFHWILTFIAFLGLILSVQTLVSGYLSPGIRSLFVASDTEAKHLAGNRQKDRPTYASRVPS